MGGGGSHGYGAARTVRTGTGCGSGVGVSLFRNASWGHDSDGSSDTGVAAYRRTTSRAMERHTVSMPSYISDSAGMAMARSSFCTRAG